MSNINTLGSTLRTMGNQLDDLTANTISLAANANANTGGIMENNAKTAQLVANVNSVVNTHRNALSAVNNATRGYGQVA